MKQISKKQETTVSLYLNSLRKFPRLKHDEAVELFKLLESGSENQVEQARKKLIESNLRLVVSIAKQYKNHDMPIEDLIQEGNIGLMKSISKFDWTRGYRFSTYATWWIRQAVGQHILKRKKTVRLPAHAATVQRRIIQVTQDYKKRFNTEPTIEELIELTGASETVIKATMAAGRGTISLSQPISSLDGDTYEDHLVDNNPGSDPSKNVLDKEMLEITNRVMMNLNQKESAILRLRFGLVEDQENNVDYPITENELDDIKNGKGLE